MISKTARDLYAHTTNLDSLTKILSSGNLLSLKQVAEQNPEHEISVEPLPLPVRMRIKAQPAYDLLSLFKEPDNIFLTKGGYVGNYGDAVITKPMARKMDKGTGINSIPGEYVTKKPISMGGSTKIYVPDNVLETFRQAFPQYRILPKDQLPISAFGFSDRVRALAEKAGLVKESSSLSEYRKMFGRNADIVGSEALGLELEGSSDVDIFVPYSSRHAYEMALKRMAERYPDMVMNEVSKNRDDKKTFVGTVDGKPMDVVIAYGDRARKFKQAFGSAKARLTEQRRAEIKARKQALHDSFFFPKTRYRMYKREIADELGLRDAYF